MYRSGFSFRSSVEFIVRETTSSLCEMDEFIDKKKQIDSSAKSTCIEIVHSLLEVDHLLISVSSPIKTCSVWTFVKLNEKTAKTFGRVQNCPESRLPDNSQ